MGSTTERWKQAYALLDELLDLPVDQRDQKLAPLAPPLREMVQRLLDEAGRDTGPLDHPIHTEPGSLAGTRVGRYEIEHEIGRGGSAVVYRARRIDVEFEQHVALKILTVGQMAAGALERFRREQEILARLQHPNVVGLLDAGVAEDGTAYLAMPLVDGMPIDRWCTQHALSIRERVRLFLQVVDAIAFAQKTLIVHRDLKPGNVLVSHNGQVSVLDFGIAKLIDDGSPEEQTSTRVLTPKFGAPEQWSGAPVTTATDVYALGATLYVLLCDELPDPDESTRRKGLDGVDRDLKNVVGRAMQSESERRYDGALALGQDLRRWLDGRPVLATPDSLSYRLRKYVRRNRAMVAASALGVSALCAGATLAFSQAMEARRQTHVAQAMTQFLIDSFQSADPYRGDEEMSARQIVAHGIKRVDVALADIPEARGQMLFVLGDLSGLLGQYEQSESLLSRALKNDLEPRQRFRAVTRYGHTLTILGRYDAAETQFQEASRLADALRLNFDERAVFETERASYLLEARRHDEALNALNTVMNQPDFDKDLSLERRATLHGIRAEILRTLGDFDQSLVHVERALKLHEESTLNVVDKADTYRLAAGIYSDLGQLDRSEELERTGLGESLKRHGPDDRRTLVSRNNLALLLKNRGRFSDSEEMLSEVLASQQRTLGAEHPDAGATLFNLAEAQLHQKKYSQALGAYLRAVKNVETHFPNSPRVAVNRVIYPRALGRAGRIDEARETFASGLELAPAGNPPHPLTGRLRVEYAGFLNEQSQFPEALAELEPVVPVLRETYGPASREYALAQYQRGISLQDAPEGREALSLALRILSDSPFRERYRAEINHCSTLLNRSPGQ